jgi:hypothetical protein
MNATCAEDCPVQDPVRDTPAPRVEPKPLAEPAPEPVNPIDRHAQQVSRSVWRNGGIHRNQLFPRGMRRSAQDELLDYAVNRGWLTVNENDGMVSPGVKNPIPVMPPVRSRSSERPGVLALDLSGSRRLTPE